MLQLNVTSHCWACCENLILLPRAPHFIRGKRIGFAVPEKMLDTTCHTLSVCTSAASSPVFAPGDQLSCATFIHIPHNSHVTVNWSGLSASFGKPSCPIPPSQGGELNESLSEGSRFRTLAESSGLRTPQVCCLRCSATPMYSGCWVTGDGL